MNIGRASCSITEETKLLPEDSYIFVLCVLVICIFLLTVAACSLLRTKGTHSKHIPTMFYTPVEHGIFIQAQSQRKTKYLYSSHHWVK